MKTTHWKDIAELVGITAIVASLIFVGLQMKQSQEIAVAAQYQDRAANLNDMALSILQSDRSLRLRGESFLEGAWRALASPDMLESFDRYTPEDLGAKWYEFVSISSIAENNHFQYEAGFLDEASWAGVLFRMRFIFNDPLNRHFYALGRRGFRPEFQAIADSIIAEIESENL